MDPQKRWLIIGIVILCLGLALNMIYEESGIPVTATITRISTRSSDEGYRHTYYGSYTVGGKEYTDKKLSSSYSSDMSSDRQQGDTMQIVVSESGRMLPQGGVLGVLGLILVVWNAYKLIRRKKATSDSSVTEP